MAKRPGWLAFLACVGIATAPGAAGAGPVVSIGSRTVIELEPVHRLGPDTIQVHGKLVDKYSHEPAAWEVLSVSVDGSPRVLTTDGEGHFATTFVGIVGGGHHLVVQYDGKPGEYSGATFEISNFDIQKRALSLTVSFDRDLVSYSERKLQVSVSGKSDGDHPPAGVGPIDLLISDDDDGTPAVRVAQLTTDATGKKSATLAGPQLGPPGRKRIEVVFAGNDEWDPARTELGFLLRTGTSMAFKLDDNDIAHESKVRGTGKLIDDAGAGVAGATIELVLHEPPAGPGAPAPAAGAPPAKPAPRPGGTPLAKATTGDDGSFTLSVAGSELGPGRFNLQAEFDSAVEWRTDSRAVVTVDIAQPRPAPVSYTLAVFGATLFSVLAFVAVRTKPWTKIKWRRRTDPSATADADHPADPGTARAGLQLARPSMMSTLRRVRDTGFVGAVCNAVNGRPVGAATLLLHSDAHGSRAADSDGAGRFELEGLPGATWQVSVAAYGYCTERFSITIPHRGELRGARIDLLPVRERIFALYGECAKPLLPESGLWGIWTPRQIFAHVRGGRPAPALAELTDFVEEAYFSQRTPEEDAVQVTRDRIAAVRAEASSGPADRV